VNSPNFALTEFYEVHLLRVKVFFDLPADNVSHLTKTANRSSEPSALEGSFKDQCSLQ
jgi:hypothetical protein